MRYGVFGDVHANLPALEAVLAALRAQRVDGWLCLGDLVGYGADARACVERVRELDPVLVGGNHDWAVAGRLDLDWFNLAAREAIVWTQRVLPREHIECVVADGAGGTEHADANGGAHGSTHTDCQPSAATYPPCSRPSSNSGTPAARLSSRSSTPP